MKGLVLAVVIAGAAAPGRAAETPSEPPLDGADFVPWCEAQGARCARLLGNMLGMYVSTYEPRTRTCLPQRPEDMPAAGETIRAWMKANPKVLARHYPGSTYSDIVKLSAGEAFPCLKTGVYWR